MITQLGSIRRAEWKSRRRNPEHDEAALLPDVDMPPRGNGDTDDGRGALTPEEREQLILEQRPVPGPDWELACLFAWKLQH